MLPGGCRIATGRDSPLRGGPPQAYQQPMGATGMPAEAFAFSGLSQAGMMDQLQASFANLSTSQRSQMPTSRGQVGGDASVQPSAEGSARQ